MGISSDYYNWGQWTTPSTGRVQIWALYQVRSLTHSTKDYSNLANNRKSIYSALLLLTFRIWKLLHRPECWTDTISSIDEPTKPSTPHRLSVIDFHQLAFALGVSSSQMPIITWQLSCLGIPWLFTRRLHNRFQSLNQSQTILRQVRNGRGHG